MSDEKVYAIRVHGRWWLAHRRNNAWYPAGAVEGVGPLCGEGLESESINLTGRDDGYRQVLGALKRLITALQTGEKLASARTLAELTLARIDRGRS